MTALEEIKELERATVASDEEMLIALTQEASSKIGMLRDSLEPL